MGIAYDAGDMISAPVPFRLRPLPLSELLDETFRLYRRNFALLAGLSLLLSIPGLLYTLLSGQYRTANVLASLRLITGPGGGAGAVQPLSADQLSTLAVWSAVYGLLALLLVPFAIGVLFQATSDVVQGRAATVGSVLRAVLARYWRLWGVVLLFVLAFFTFLLFPLWLWIMVRWSVAIPALLAEGIGPRHAVGRSWTLVKGRWWRTFGILIVVFVMQSVLVYALGALMLGLVALVPGLSPDVRAALVAARQAVAGSLVGVISYVALTLLYLDLRVRQEGLDLEQLARQTGPPAPEPA